MTINIIAVILFFIVLVVVAFTYRNSTLEKLPIPDGESILFEEHGARVEQHGSPRSVIFRNCIVRVTNLRIIIAQKMLLSKGHALRFVIEYNKLSGNTDLKATFRKGYLNFTVTAADLKVDEKNGEHFVRIDIPHTALTGNQYVEYMTSIPGRYRNLA